MNNNWISVKEDIEGKAIIFYRDFEIDNLDKKVELDITSIGLYKVFINDKIISNRILTPGLTSYPFRLMYQSYDITNLLQIGNNKIEIYVAPGWAVGHYGISHIGHWISNKIALNLEVRQDNKTLFISDEDFSAKESFVEFADIYQGEKQDFSKKEFANYEVEKVSHNMNLVPNEGEDILEREIVKPVSLIISPKGEKIIDFGQNLVGYIHILNPKKGTYKFYPGEILDKDGNFYNENYRLPKNEVEFVIGEDNIKEVKPWFSFQGYRYLKVVEYPGEIDLLKIESIVIYSNIKRISYFKCDNPKINQLYSNVIWGQKGNFVDIPTDCPQRDERLGWTGDAQVFSRTACYNFDCEKFYRKWLKDMKLEQKENGEIFGFVPHPFENIDTSSGWGDACAIVPYQVYDAYGHKEVLKENLEMMRGWVRYMHNYGPEEYLWLTHNAFGDWLALDLEAGNYFGATQKDFISSAYFYYTTSLVAKIEKILGLDNSYHQNLANNIKKAFHSYFMKDGLPIVNYEKGINDNSKEDRGITQTSLSILLMFGLYEGEEERKLIAKTLSELVINNGYKLNTGFIGTPLLLSALSENGYEKVAMELLFQEEFPSWLYSVNRGATTIWEHWDGVNEKGEFWSKNMNSFNHYAYGAVMSWVIENVVGLKRLEPGYKKIKVSPFIDKRFGNISFDIETPNGNISIKHIWNNDKLETTVEADPRIEVIK